MWRDQLYVYTLPVTTELRTERTPILRPINCLIHCLKFRTKKPRIPTSISSYVTSRIAFPTLNSTNLPPTYSLYSYLITYSFLFYNLFIHDCIVSLTSGRIKTLSWVVKQLYSRLVYCSYPKWLSKISRQINYYCLL